MKIKQFVAALITYKIAVLLFIVLAGKLLPIFNIRWFMAIALHTGLHPATYQISFADHFNTWDSQHYLKIAEFGYDLSGYFLYVFANR